MAPPAAEKQAVTSGGEALYFSFTQPSWVEVRDRSGEIVFSQLNQAGSQREISGEPPFSLVVGNASRVTLHVITSYSIHYTKLYESLMTRARRGT